VKIIDKLVEFEQNIDDFDVYGRRNSLRFYNVPLTFDQISKTDDVVVAICQHQLGNEINENDIDRSHSLGCINRKGKVKIICLFRIWKIKNNIYRSKTILKGNAAKTFHNRRPDDLSSFTNHTYASTTCANSGTSLPSGLKTDELSLK